MAWAGQDSQLHSIMLDGVTMKEWESNVRVIFDKYPQLSSLIKRPIYCSAGPWAEGAHRQLLKSTGGTAGEDYYRIVFKKGSPRDLMTIGSGELSGLKTTSIIERGRITGMAGLVPVDIPTTSSLLPMLLIMGVFGAIQNRLEYISSVCVDIRNRQLLGDHAKLERISEVILDCFESIPEMDQDMIRINLSRVVANTDECHELLIVMREELERESADKPVCSLSFNESRVEYFVGFQKLTYDPVEVMRKLLMHNVFAAFERFVAGKICQIVLSRNYSASNIGRSRQAVARVRDSIRRVLDPRIRAHKNGVRDYEELILACRQGRCPGGWTLAGLEDALRTQQRTVADIEAGLDGLLDSKLKSFDVLSQLADRDGIEVYLINGSIVINEPEIPDRPEAGVVARLE